MSPPTQHTSLPHPIGVFDSGLGGLTVLSALRQQLPHEHFLYFADTRYLPYGDRSEVFLRERGLTIAQHLEHLGCKAIVIACNTATAAAAESIRAHCHLPVVALEPAVKPAVALSQKHRVGVLATTRTLSSQRFQRLLENHASNTTVFAQACPGLAEAIEAAGAESQVVSQLLDQYLQPLIDAEVDVVVLGCTHYPWVKTAIAARFPQPVTIVDSGAAVARQVQRRLHDTHSAHDSANTSQTAYPPKHPIRILTSGQIRQVEKTVRCLWGAPLSVEYSNL